MAIRAVLDTNVVLAAGGSSNTNSPNREIVHRWLAGEFTLLVTDDIIAEYAEKLASHGKSTQERVEFLTVSVTPSTPYRGSRSRHRLRA